MDNSSIRTIALDSRGVDAAIDALSSAAASFTLNRRQRIVYRTLMLSVDLGATGLLLFWSLLLPRILRFNGVPGSQSIRDIVLLAADLFLGGSIVSGLILSLFGVPLFHRVLKERARLKSLGLDSLSTSLWRASRRRPAWNGLRGAVLMSLGILYVVGALINLVRGIVQKEFFLLATVPVGVCIGALFLGARLLRNQKEKIELASQAIGLKKALQSLRQKAGANGMVTIPADFVEQAAMIESLHTAQDRRAAILQNAGKQSLGYAITYQPEALAKRSVLDVRDRLELEDLLVRLSTTGHALESEPLGRSASISRVRTASQRVELEYAMDEGTRTIYITNLGLVNVDPAAGGR